VAAAVKLLPRRSKARAAALAAFAIVIALLALSGVYLIWPVLVTGGALLYLRLTSKPA
jgi:amino acid efflux transporter